MILIGTTLSPHASSCDWQVRMEYGTARCTGCDKQFKPKEAARFVQEPKPRNGPQPGPRILCRVCYPKYKAARDAK